MIRIRSPRSVLTTWRIAPVGDAANVAMFSGFAKSSKSTASLSCMARAAVSNDTSCLATFSAALSASHSKSPCTTVGTTVILGRNERHSTDPCGGSRSRVSARQTGAVARRRQLAEPVGCAVGTRGRGRGGGGTPCSRVSVVILRSWQLCTRSGRQGWYLMGVFGTHGLREALADGPVSPRVGVQGKRPDRGLSARATFREVARPCRNAGRTCRKGEVGHLLCSACGT